MRETSERLGLAPGVTSGELEGAILGHGIPEIGVAGPDRRAEAKGGKSSADTATAVEKGRPQRRSAGSAAALSLGLPDGQGRAAGHVITKPFQAAFPDLAEKLAAERRRIAGVMEALKAAVATERTEALLVLTAAIASRYEDAKSRRGAGLRRSHRPHERPSPPQGRCGLGAIQARPGHRPHPRRRGAGHQRAAMGHPAPASWPSSPPARAGDGACARSSRSATRSSRSTPSRAPHRANSRPAAEPCTEVRDAELTFEAIAFTYSFRSGPAVLHRSITCSASRRSTAAFMRSNRHPSTRRSACRAQPDRPVGTAEAATGRTSRAGARRSTACRRHRRTWLSNRIQAVKVLVDGGTMRPRAAPQLRRRRAGAGAPARHRSSRR